MPSKKKQRVRHARRVIPHFLFVVISVCSACQARDTYDTYVHHPDVLLNKMQQCQRQTTKATSDCQRAQQAFNKIHPLLLELANNHERFGVRILQVQMQLAQTEQTYRADCDAFKKLQRQPAAEQQRAALSRKIRQQEKQIKQLKQRYQLLLRLLRFSQRTLM